MTHGTLPNVYNDESLDRDIFGEDQGDLTGGTLNDLSIPQSVEFIKDLAEPSFFDDVVDKYLNDLEEAIFTLCKGTASAISVDRTLRDGVNPTRKMIARFSVHLLKTDDDDFQ